MRSKPSSSMQKTYDECYLICSTAVYFEGQNNEAEALRSWRSALDAIYYHNAYRVPVNYVPKSETEKALQDSLRELEMQCKERVDLLEALRESRKEAGIGSDERGSLPRGKLEKERSPANGSSNSSPGWIGEGTVPPFSYPELSRPAPTLPARPMVSSRPSFESMVQRAKSDSHNPYESNSTTLPSPPTLPAMPPTKPPPRAASPERRKAMLTTLRAKGHKKSADTRLSDGWKSSRPAASRAAGLAWGSISRWSGTSTKQSSFGTESDPSATHLTLRKSVSSDSGPRRNVDTKHPSRDDVLKQKWTSYPSDYVAGGSGRDGETAGDGPVQNLAADAAAAALQTLNNAEPLVQPPNPSPLPRCISESNDSYLCKPSTNLFAKRKPRPDYLAHRDGYPESGVTIKQDNRALEISKTHPNCKSRIGKHNSEEAANSSRPPNTTSTTPPRTGERSFGQGPVPGSSGEDLNPAIRTLRSGTADSNGIKYGKRATGTRPRIPARSTDHPPPDGESSRDAAERDASVQQIVGNLPMGVDANAARQILNDVVVRGDEVHWDDVAGLETAKKALKEAVVYPFLRPDLFMGLREPARGMLLFGPPGTGKTMLARAVATESKSTFFSISASSLTSKWHGESEKLVRALFGLAKAMAPSIIFVDEIDSLLSSRSSAGEAEVSRRSKTEFLIQWSDLQRAAAGREQSDAEKRDGDPSRVLVLAATNVPWDIDEAARRRFVRRQYIPLPEDEVRKLHLQKLLSHQKHQLSNEEIDMLVKVTDGFSGSDITALAKDAAMGPLRNLGEALLHTPKDQICPIRFKDFEASLCSIRPSVSRDGLKEYEEWAKEFGERGS